MANYNKGCKYLKWNVTDDDKQHQMHLHTTYVRINIIG